MLFQVFLKGKSNKNRKITKMFSLCGRISLVTLSEVVPNLFKGNCKAL